MIQMLIHLKHKKREKKSVTHGVESKTPLQLVGVKKGHW